MPIKGYKWVKNAELGQVSVVKEEKLCVKKDDLVQNFVQI